MRISVGYQELSDLVKNRSGQKIDLAYVSQNTVKVSKEITLYEKHRNTLQKY